VLPSEALWHRVGFSLPTNSFLPQNHSTMSASTTAPPQRCPGSRLAPNPPTKSRIAPDTLFSSDPPPPPPTPPHSSASPAAQLTPCFYVTADGFDLEYYYDHAYYDDGYEGDDEKEDEYYDETADALVDVGNGYDDPGYDGDDEKGYGHCYDDDEQEEASEKGRSGARKRVHDGMSLSQESKQRFVG
jgi:hypothetical protein